MPFLIPPLPTLKTLARENWKSGLTVALISVPLSIAISIASGAGPIPGVITGIWGTMIASLFGGSNYNIIGAAGALTTVLFAATLAAPLGLGAAALPLLALLSGLFILLIWAIQADRFLYYIPSSVMYGFSAGVALLIAASQLFDAFGLSSLKRTGTFHGDIELLVTHAGDAVPFTVATFVAALVFILVWKRYVKALPAVIPVSLLGIIFGWVNSAYLSLPALSLGDKFGAFSARIIEEVPWGTLPTLITNPTALVWCVKAAGLIALIAVLETLITAKIGDKVTKTQSSSERELLGLALANIGSGLAGGLPATGVFIRAGANIRAGATHRMSAFLAALFTAAIALVVLPLFTYIPMAVIAAILVNTAIGLIEVEKIREFWKHEKSAFAIFAIVALVTVLEDAGAGVIVGAIASLLVFADSVSHGRFDATFNYEDGSFEKIHGAKVLHVPHDTRIPVVIYSIAGLLGYIDSERHAANLRHLARAKGVEHVVIRLRDLFSMDYEGQDMLAESVLTLTEHGKTVYISSARPDIIKELHSSNRINGCVPLERFTKKTEDALRAIGTIA